MIDNGIKVKIKIALFFDGEITKIAIPIRNEMIIFLKAGSTINGLLESENSNEKRNKVEIAAKMESAMF